MLVRTFIRMLPIDICASVSKGLTDVSAKSRDVLLLNLQMRVQDACR